MRASCQPCDKNAAFSATREEEVKRENAAAAFVIFERQLAQEAQRNVLRQAAPHSVRRRRCSVFVLSHGLPARR